MSKLILVLNPGSTSTKLGIFKDTKNIVTETLRHSSDEIAKFKSIPDQKEFRKEAIEKFLKKSKYKIQDFDCIMARGGLLRPIEGGTYTVNKKMVDDLKSGKYEQHASNLGALIAYDYAKKYHIPAYIADPVVVDELAPIARLSGSIEIPRRSIFHALNQKAVARRYAESIRKKYEQLNLIVVHMGGGVSVGLHVNGKVVDVNDALGGDGPFSPERAGGVPAFPLVDLCFKKGMDKKTIKKMLVGNAGLVGYLGTNDVGATLKKMKTDKKAKLVIEAMVYQIAKEIGAVYFANNCKCDQLILTGGIAYNKQFTDMLLKLVIKKIPATIYPGEDELLALATAGIKVLTKKAKAKTY